MSGSTHSQRATSLSETYDASKLLSGELEREDATHMLSYLILASLPLVLYYGTKTTVWVARHVFHVSVGVLRALYAIVDFLSKLYQALILLSLAAVAALGCYFYFYTNVEMDSIVDDTMSATTTRVNELHSYTAIVHETLQLAYNMLKSSQQ